MQAPGFTLTRNFHINYRKVPKDSLPADVRQSKRIHSYMTCLQLKGCHFWDTSLKVLRAVYLSLLEMLKSAFVDDSNRNSWMSNRSKDGSISKADESMRTLHDGVDIHCVCLVWGN